MYKTRLTPRQISITLYLLQTDSFLSSSRLSEEFDISVRTVKSEMEQIRFWLRAQGEELEANRGKGFRIAAHSPERKRELKLLLQSTERMNSPMDQQMRLKQILIDLFMAKGAVTTYSFSEKMRVSQNTIFNDILLLEEEIAKYEVYVKSSHFGYFLKGEELAIRELISDLLFAESTNFDVSNLISQFSQERQNLSEFRVIFSNEDFRKIYQEVIKLVTENLSILSDKIENYSILSFIIRLCISIARVQNSKQLSSKRFALNKDRGALEKFLFQVYEEFGLEALSDEFVYVTAKQVILDQFDIPKFTSQVIHEVSKVSSIRFDKDAQLFQNLHTHFSLTFSKGCSLTDEYNPFANDIKLKQTEIFEQVKEALAKFLPETIKVDDAFVGYAALHFLVSIERGKNLERDIKVLYVCSTGVGVTSFIQQKVASRIKNIEITGFSSILNVQNSVTELKPDLIISVFPIEGLEIPVIEVNALLTENDLQRIQKQVEFLLRAGMGSPRSAGQAAESEARDLPVELIVKAFNVYFELKTLFDFKKEENERSIEFLEGFLVHVLLMVSRVENDAQYQEFSSTGSDELAHKIMAICQRHDLPVNKSEISALISYYEYHKQEMER